MARDIILDICDAIKTASAVSDIEEACRYEVAQEMEYQDRLLDDAEIEDVVDSVVRDEAFVDPIDSISEDNIVNMTDIEWGNIPSSDKVIDTDGDESIIIEGSIYKVLLRKDDRVERITAKIAKEIVSAWAVRNSLTGIAADKETYMTKLSEDLDMSCPDCGSYNQTLVWFDGNVRYWHCNECGGEYEVPIDEYDMSVEEMTTEDIPIYEDDEDSVFGSVFYDGELGWTWQIWHNGECIEQQLADDAGEAYGIFNTVKREYESRTAGERLKFDNGESLAIEDIDGDVVELEGCRMASRAEIAVDLTLGRITADRSDVYAFDVESGDCYRNLKGEEIEVLAANGQEVLYMSSEMDKYTLDYRTDYHTASRNSFVDYLVEKGYIA